MFSAEYLLGYALGCFIVCGGFAFACYKIMQSKGYPKEACSDEAFWGFWLNFIWIIVVACKPAATPEVVAKYKYIKKESNEAAGPLDNLAIALTVLSLIVVAIGIFIVIKISWWGYALVAAALALLFWMLSW